MPHERKGEKAGESHDSYTADLDKEHDDDMSRMCEGRCYVDCCQSGHSDGCGRDEQGVYEMNPVYCGVWQHQQSRTDKNDKHEAQQEQEGRLDMALQQCECLT